MKHFIYRVGRECETDRSLYGLPYLESGESVPDLNGDIVPLELTGPIRIDRAIDEVAQLSNAVNLVGARAWAWDASMFQVCEQLGINGIGSSPLEIYDAVNAGPICSHSIVFIAPCLEVLDKDQTELDEENGVIFSMEDLVLKQVFIDTSGNTVDPDTVHLARMAEYKRLCIVSEQFVECVRSAGLSGNIFTDPAEFCI